MKWVNFNTHIGLDLLYLSEKEKISVPTIICAYRDQTYCNSKNQIFRLFLFLLELLNTVAESESLLLLNKASVLF